MPRHHELDDEGDELDEGPQDSDIASDDEEETETLYCPNCGAQVYEFADRCPKCGDHIVPVSRPPGRPRWQYVTGVALLIALVLLWSC